MSFVTSLVVILCDATGVEIRRQAGLKARQDPVGFLVWKDAVSVGIPYVRAQSVLKVAQSEKHSWFVDAIQYFCRLPSSAE